MSDTRNVCYDCLKTRGFSLTILLVAAGLGIIFGVIFGWFEFPPHLPWIMIFIGFWVVISLLAFIVSLIAYQSIRKYCDPNDQDTYKQPEQAAGFGFTTAVFIIIVVLTITYLPENYNHYIPLFSVTEYETSLYGQDYITVYEECSNTLFSVQCYDTGKRYTITEYCDTVDPNYKYCD